MSQFGLHLRRLDAAGLTFTNGLLQVAEGIHVVDLHLTGTNATGNSASRSDGHDRTVVAFNPTAAQMAAAHNQMASAMAGFGGATGTSSSPVVSTTGLDDAPMLAPHHA